MVEHTTIAYFALQSTGLLFLAILAATFLLPFGISRHATIPNNIVLWIFECISACLLLFSGNYNQDHPPLAICKVQSALQYGAPPAMAAGALSLVFRVWYLTWSSGRLTPAKMQDTRKVTAFLVGLPYVVWALVACVSGILAGGDVHRVGAYCATNNNIPTILSGIGSAVLLVAAFALQVWSMVIVSKRYGISGHLGSQEMGSADPSTFIRVAIFTGFVLIALVLSILAVVSTWSAAIPDMFVASMPVMVFIVFATQRDVLELWRLVKPRNRLPFSTHSQSRSHDMSSNNRDRESRRIVRSQAGESYKLTREPSLARKLNYSGDPRSLGGIARHASPYNRDIRTVNVELYPPRPRQPIEEEELEDMSEEGSVLARVAVMVERRIDYDKEVQRGVDEPGGSSTLSESTLKPVRTRPVAEGKNITPLHSISVHTRSSP